MTAASYTPTEHKAPASAWKKKNLPTFTVIVRHTLTGNYYSACKRGRILSLRLIRTTTTECVENIHLDSQ